MSNPAEEVIDLIESSEGENDDFDEIVVVATLPPKLDSSLATTTSLEHARPKRRKLHAEDGIDDVIEKSLKGAKIRRCTDGTPKSGKLEMTATKRTEQTNHKEGSRILIDQDGVDNATLSPGYLPSREKWISSGETVAIVQHVRQTDKWSCGYRNLQMMLSSILPQLPADHTMHQKYPRRQNQVTIPSLHQIQRAMESAWSEGMDPQGAAHYRHKLCGKKSWIGAVEVSTALSYWGIDSTVVQFIRCHESRKLLPNFTRAYFSKALGQSCCPFCWQNALTLRKQERPLSSAFQHAQQLLSYKSTSNSSAAVGRQCKCPLLPLYLQWEGHSVTIVGTDGSDTLLIFDPLKQQKPSKLPISKLVHKDTQILMVTTFRSLTVAEHQLRKGGNESQFVATAAPFAVARSIQGR